jgi:DNA-binding IclR family transcriptional regulator
MTPSPDPSSPAKSQPSPATVAAGVPARGRGATPAGAIHVRVPDYRIDGFQERSVGEAPLVQFTDMLTKTTLYIDLQPLIEARLAESRRFMK